MRYMANFAKVLMIVLALAGLAPQAHAAFIQTPGVNIDVPFNDDPVCGFAIIVSAAQAPTNFYTGTRNPWGAPTVTQLGPGLWLLQFGGPSGPCFPRSLFFENGVFKGLHFGFHTSVTLVQFQGSPCWVFGVNGSTPCSGITGHSSNGGGIQVINGGATAVALNNAAVALSRTQIEINDLTRDDLDHLSWEPLSLESNVVPAAADGRSGTLWIGVPEHLQGQGGWVVFSYDVTDPKTSRVQSTVTLEVQVP